MVDKDQAEPQPESALVLAGTSKRPLAIAEENQDTDDNFDGEEMEEKDEEEIEEEEDVRPLKKKNSWQTVAQKNPYQFFEMCCGPEQRSGTSSRV
jgi:hypothetical protein